VASESQAGSPRVWADDEPTAALRQLGRIVADVFSPIDVHVASSGTSFEGCVSPEGRDGVCAVSGQVQGDAAIVLAVELVRLPRDARGVLLPVFRRLSSLSDMTHIAEPEVDKKTGEAVVRATLGVKAAPMAPSREAAFVAELERLDELARDIQSSLPAVQINADLAKLYKPVSEHLEPVQPAPDLVGPALSTWARETIELLMGNASVAVATPQPILQQYALTALATVGREFGTTFGRLLPPLINTKGFVQLATQAPGVVATPVVRLSLGTNRYDLGNEMQATLSALTDAGRPALFVGSMAELQEVFSGGQGGVSDPLRPVVRHVPAVAIDTLARFAVRQAGAGHKGLPSGAEDSLVADTLAAIEHASPAEQSRILPMVAARAVNAWAKCPSGATTPVDAYVANVRGLSETLAGLSDRPRAVRSPEVQQNFTQTLSDPRLLDQLTESLLAQDWALGQLVARLRTEALTRPLGQPLRYCAQGTPGTGKSESTLLIAHALGVPYINIDAASMPDYYTAAAQLLGSGRGIVGSYQSGRLEQAAKHHRGAVIEVSDLDHAVPSVRSALGDLFLQVLETGQGQSAAGAMFSCCNVLFVFTMNLPDGMDEFVRSRVGFCGAPSRRDVGEDVMAEIKRVLSGAFLSRVGTPILFEPLDGPALAAIVERAVRAAVNSAAERLGLEVGDIAIEAGVGEQIVASMDASTLSFGARVLLEHGRALAAEGMDAARHALKGLTQPVLRVSMGPDGRLTIQPE